MKKSLIITMVLLLFAVNTSALYCPDCDFGDGKYRIMTAEEPKVEGVISKNVEETGKGCLSGEAGEVDNVSLNRSGEGYRLEFVGSMQTPNPCQSFGYKIEKNGSNYVLKTAYRQENDTCVQCIGRISYHVDITFNNSFSLQVVHQGERVTTIVGTENGLAMYQSKKTSERNKTIQTPETMEEEFNTSFGKLKAVRTNASCHDSTGSKVNGVRTNPVKNGGDTTGYSIGIQGYVETADPCSLLDAEMEEEGDTVIINLADRTSDKNCVQCTGKVGFRITGRTHEKFSLEVRHGDTVLKKVRRGYNEEKTVLERFITFLLSFF